MSFLPAIHAFSGPFVLGAAKYYAKPNVIEEMNSNSYLRGNSRKRRRTGVSGKLKRPMKPAGTRVTYSPGLTIGKDKPPTVRQLIQNIIQPPIHFNSKWTFQCDALSGRVAAITIPVLTRTLIDPLANQLFSNATTDTVTIDPNMGSQVVSNQPIASQYRVNIRNYRSDLIMYNSATTAVRCRLVWYKPTYNMQNTLSTTASGRIGTIQNSPLNCLMYASNLQHGILGGGLAGVPFIGTVGDGTLFDDSSSGANYNADYQHAGATLVGDGTTSTSNLNNVTAYLDPRLVPGAPEVRAFVNRYWKTLKSEEFLMEPGTQYNTSLTYRNKMIKRITDDDTIFHWKDFTAIGVLYVIGQMGFDERVANTTISTTAGQVSVMRTDTCVMQVDTVRRTRRINMTRPFVSIENANVAYVDPETDRVQGAFDQDF